MRWHFTDGWSLGELSADVAMTADYELKAEEKLPFLTFACSAASKTLTLGLEPGDHMILTNTGGTNAVTVKNIEGDTGVSVAKGKVALAIGGTSTADTFTCLVLN